jgi:hypothetical protein
MQHKCSTNAAQMQPKSSQNVMQLERAPNRGPSNLAAKCSTKNHAARESA